MRPFSVSGFVPAILLAASVLSAQQHPTPETAAWWAQTTALSNDRMEGRDTGSEAYDRAARYVADKFAAAGLKPAGENGTFFQSVPMREIALDPDGSSIAILHLQGPDTTLHFTSEVTMVPRGSMRLPVAPLVFTGYGLPLDGFDLKDKIAVFFNNIPAGLPAAERATFAARRMRALAESGAVAILSIDNPTGLEPFHWPAAYAKSVTLATTAVVPSQTPPVIRVNSANLEDLFPEDPHAWEILPAGIKGAPLPKLLPGTEARIRLSTYAKEIASPNILAILPGSDPALAPEYVALSAHLDGYGYGTAVLGDSVYNGTLDDAAYVALLLEMARDLKAHPPARSILFCIFTGEEKGLLGSAWFTAHPTVPVRQIVADLNLDQLRPIFPLKILTMEGIDDSTIGATARGIAASMGIELRADREPERNLYRRADNYNFSRVGVPIGSFIFGYNPGSAEEFIYRDWYTRRYHKPQDDLNTPINWAAAAKFNRFYQQLAVALANAPARPAWLASSPNAPKP
ncbi:Peptidase family M28 [Granulicella pectinivorans]|jgi:hypothetical protein|uniref:Peptidase family M28 n=1 Tax=Granulicella pectinivorans TaxID=474950 RepID=A0A1I6LB45_9BACT|nr:M28 family peptidase [Granulicella pectinivorans]SFS00687.1 Peptidase family M28 [Granulicella pectinivorans]